MKSYFLIILISIFSFSCNSDDKNSNTISDSDLKEIGNKLAEWGDTNCKLITINTKEILLQGANAGGCSPVGFEFNGTGSSFFDERVNTIQNNLRELINNSNCKISELKNNVLGITSNSSTDLISRHLECLGVVEFLKGSSGIE